jgi:hypothetical protein
MLDALQQKNPRSGLRQFRSTAHLNLAQQSHNKNKRAETLLQIDFHNTARTRRAALAQDDTCLALRL